MSTYIGGGKVYVYSFQDVGIPLHNHYKYVYHNTNAMVVERDRLSGNHQESISFFGKHHLYCNKVDTCTYPNGETCNWVIHYPGSTTNITIFRENV